MKTLFKYTVTKRFIDGNLKGMTIEEQTDVKFDVGFQSTGSFGGSNYIVEACIENV